ncbi:MAG: anti-sigma factor [Betaproteobacteria bacterium]
MDLARPDRARRLDSLAAEYALGTLSLRARRRLAGMARDDPRIAAALRNWEYRLAALAEAVPAVAPASRVWEGIRARLGFQEKPDAARASRWWGNLSLWRGLAAGGFALALALGVLRVAPTDSGDTSNEAVVVVLAGPDARPALVASASRGGRTLLVKAVGNLAVESGRTFELWALPDGRDPQSLGILPAAGVSRFVLQEPAGIALRNVPALAVSLEPAGGSPTGKPTGPVLYTGAVQRLY